MSEQLTPQKPQKRTIEETYQHIDPITHVLRRPDTFVGSIEFLEQEAWLYSQTQGLYQKKCMVNQGLLHIFDEIVVNAGDHKTRNPTSMTYIRVDITPTYVKVVNNGPGIPIEIHKDWGKYVPEGIFGDLRCSSNYNDEEEKLTGGRNGYGAKLTNIFSKEFEVKTVDATTKQKFEMTWKKNMTQKSEPKITLLKSTNPIPYTSITYYPDFDKFGCSEFSQDMQEIMAKRLIDLAGTNEKLKIQINHQPVKISGFKKYAQMRSNPHPVGFVKSHPRWEIGIAASSSGEFEQVSFVNNICTSKGGTHVKQIQKIIEDQIREKLQQQFKGSKIITAQIRNNLRIYLNVRIVNPAFSSQTKEELTSRPSSFGSKHGVTSSHVSKLIHDSNILEIIQQRLSSTLGVSKTLVSTTKSRNLGFIKGLEDANHAGTKHSLACTLYLIEGLSAQSLATAGIPETSGKRNLNGSFALRGKLLNPRDMDRDKIMTKTDILNLCKILNLKDKLDYQIPQNYKTLRYGHVAIMTDQDDDGAHIAGLIINFFHWYNPTILKVRGFLKQFVTPVIKVRNKKTKKTVESFFSEDDYKTWIQDKNPKDYLIKFYKGLGTSTIQEAKEYFRNLGKHLKDFEVLPDSELIELAFSKKRAQDRKAWSQTKRLKADFAQQPREYTGFFNSSFLQYVTASIHRAIPNIMDGFKPIHRKILFAAMKLGSQTSLKISVMGSKTSELTQYHHGEASMYSAIIRMAQQFVGKNNLNLMFPDGAFGTRLRGGDDAAAARYISTQLMPIARRIFMNEDDPILNYLEDEGTSIEPETFLPILPMILVNGCHGIATGWSTDVPMHNLLDIIRGVELYLDQKLEEDFELRPYYNGFTGEIKPNSKGGYDTYGIFVFKPKTKSIQITELPIGIWTAKYKESICTKFKDQITSFKDNSTESVVNLEFCLSDSTWEKYHNNSELTIKDFNLSTSLSTNNMKLIVNEQVRHFPSTLSILKEFCKHRILGYQKRKQYQLYTLSNQIQVLEQKIQFIQKVLSQEIPLLNCPETQTFEALSKFNLPNTLLDMKLSSLNKEQIQKLSNELQTMKQHHTQISNTTPQDMWRLDLQNLKTSLK